MKIIIALSDRGYCSELDLRKNKLSNLNKITIFQLDDGGNIIGKAYNAFYYSYSSHIRFFTLLNEGLNYKNFNSNNGSGYGFVSKSQFDNFSKFVKKHGKYFEFDNLDSFIEMSENVLNSYEILKEKVNEYQTFIESSPSIDYKDRSGRYRKINYKNIAICNKNGMVLSDSDTLLTHQFKGEYGNNFHFGKFEKPVDYYSYYNYFLTNNSGDSQYNKIYKLGKKKYEKAIIIGMEVENLSNNLINLIKESFKQFFSL